MKLTSIVSIGIIVVGVILFLLQLWFQLLPATVFIKTMITLGVVLVTIVIIALIKREYISDKELKKDKFLD